jgi:RHS repeat-associated protein
LGSAGRWGVYKGIYFPWGEAKGTPNPQDTWNFATYWQDSNTGLDYANNRYYSNGSGRFMTPDPATSSASPQDPQSWNRYAYVIGDPVNRNDPSGLEGGPPPGYCDDPINFSNPICSCPNGICNPPGGTGGPGLPSQVPCYQDWQKAANALFDVGDAILDKVLHDSNFNFTQTEVYGLTNLLDHTASNRP